MKDKIIHFYKEKQISDIIIQIVFISLMLLSPILMLGVPIGILLFALYYYKIINIATSVIYSCFIIGTIGLAGSVICRLCIARLDD